MQEHGSIWFLSVIAARSLIVFLWLVIGLRLLGKRQIGQLNIYDLALVLTIANAVQNAMTEGSGHLAVGIAAAGSLILAGRTLTAWFIKLPRLEEYVAGTPTLIINNGRLVRDHMRRERISEEQVNVALRQHGLDDPSQAKLAVLEIDGTLSIVPQDAPSEHTRHRSRNLRRP